MEQAKDDESSDSQTGSSSHTVRDKGTEPKDGDSNVVRNPLELVKSKTSSRLKGIQTYFRTFRKNNSDVSKDSEENQSSEASHESTNPDGSISEGHSVSDHDADIQATKLHPHTPAVATAELRSHQSCDKPTPKKRACLNYAPQTPAEGGGLENHVRLPHTNTDNEPSRPKATLRPSVPPPLPPPPLFHHGRATPLKQQQLSNPPPVPPRTHTPNLRQSRKPVGMDSDTKTPKTISQNETTLVGSSPSLSSKSKLKTDNPSPNESTSRDKVVIVKDRDKSPCIQYTVLESDCEDDELTEQSKTSVDNQKPILVSQTNSESDSQAPPFIPVECIGSKDEKRQRCVTSGQSVPSSVIGNDHPTVVRQFPLNSTSIKPDQTSETQQYPKTDPNISNHLSNNLQKETKQVVIYANNLSVLHVHQSKQDEIRTIQRKTVGNGIYNSDQPTDTYNQAIPNRTAPQPPIPRPNIVRYGGPTRGYSIPSAPWRETSQHPPPLPLPPHPPLPTAADPPPSYYRYYGESEPRPYMPTTEPVPDTNRRLSFTDRFRKNVLNRGKPSSQTWNLASPFSIIFSRFKLNSTDLQSRGASQFSNISSASASRDSVVGWSVDGKATTAGCSGAWMNDSDNMERVNADQPPTRKHTHRHTVESDLGEDECLCRTDSQRLVLQLVCCCCWPFGLAAWILTTTILRGEIGFGRSCNHMLAKQMSLCALLVGIASYLVFLVFILSVLTVSVSAS